MVPMINKLIQSAITEIRDAIKRIAGVIDQDGNVIACTETLAEGELRAGIFDKAAYKSVNYIAGGYTYRAVHSQIRTEYVVFVEGEDNDAERFSELVAVMIANIKNLYDEKYDKTSFIKNVMLENILSGEVYVKSRELHFEDTRRFVFLIKFQDECDILPIDIIQNMFPEKNKDYVVNVTEKDIVLVKEMPSGPYGSGRKEIENIARSIVDTVSSEFFVKTLVGISNAAESVGELSRAFKEAQMALEVGKVFEDEKSFIHFDNLGIGRLIYQLPITLCNMFLREVFHKGSFESLDKESLSTIQSFFENNLNVSETSRKLFVHRNTLVYRLEKIKKITGLDLREFDHAITFKVALMVKKYLSRK